jgi:hypothetical protein
MRNFQDETRIGSKYTTIPKKAQIPEELDLDQLRGNSLWRKPFVWIIAIILAYLLIISIALSVLTPTVAKLNLRMMCKNYTVTVSSQKIDYPGAKVSTELKINGNVIAKNVGDGDYAYFEIEDGVLYKYIPYHTGWEKEACSNIFNGQTEDTDPSIIEIWSKLFNLFHYEPSKYEPSVWQLKEDVDVGDMYGVQITRKDGHFTLTWGQDGYKYHAVFKGFLFTYFPIPFELIHLIYFN